MARSAVVRSASLTPTEAALADQAARSLAGGSFSELVRLLLRYYAEPLTRRMEELREAGLDPDARLVGTWAGEEDAEAEARDLYSPRPDNWRR